jgi:hypothetical protein
MPQFGELFIPSYNEFENSLTVGNKSVMWSLSMLLLF